MTSLSVGVKSTGILVNSLSKLQVSRRLLCRTGGVGGSGVTLGRTEGNEMECDGGEGEKTFFVTSLKVIAQLFFFFSRRHICLGLGGVLASMI